MSIRPIIFLDNESKLREPTQSITQFNHTLQTLITDMFDTMYEAKGIGLAAPQIGISQKITVIDVTKDRSQQFCLINPEIIWAEGHALLTEGCLSIPGVMSHEIPRATKVKVKSVDAFGKPQLLEADGLLAHCIQHEVDHLNGKLFIDYLSALKQERMREKCDKVLKNLSYLKG